MPMSLAKLVANSAHTVLDFGDGDTINIEYRPDAITGDMLQSFASLDDLKGLPARQSIALLASATDTMLSLIAGWDLTDVDGGDVVPLDREHVGKLGLMLQWRILSAVMKAGVGSGGQGEATAPRSLSGASGAGFSRTARRKTL